MKKSLIICLLLTSSLGYAQMNMDSLLIELTSNENFIKKDDIKRLSAYFQRYESKDGRELYDVFIDSVGNLSEFIGLSIVCFLKDEEDRITSRIGYNLNGEYYLWDFSPITKTEYRGDSTIVDSYNYKKVLKERRVTVVDTLDRLIENIRFDKNLDLTVREVTSYLDSSNQSLKIRYGPDNNFQEDDLGMWMISKKYDQSDTTLILEEIYFDLNKTLVDADHKYLNRKNPMEYQYSKIRREVIDGVVISTYYNSKGDLVCIEEYGAIYTINNTKKN